jgi:hypothetical protein
VSRRKPKRANRPFRIKRSLPNSTPLAAGERNTAYYDEEANLAGRYIRKGDGYLWALVAYKRQGRQHDVWYIKQVIGWWADFDACARYYVRMRANLRELATKQSRQPAKGILLIYLIKKAPFFSRFKHMPWEEDPL